MNMNRTTEPEARASLYHSLTAQSFDRAQFDAYLNTYLRTRSSALLAAPGLAPLQDATQPELAAFAQIQAADYLRAKELIKAMAPTDRAVLAFWAEELSGMIVNVQTMEERY